MTELAGQAPRRTGVLAGVLAGPGPLALAAVLLLLWLAGLGSAPLFDVDEGAFAEASREMVASGDWGHTTLNGADRFDKPILVYWLQAASLVVFGNTEFAARLPSALCAWAWCLASAAFVAPRWGRPAALLAAGMLATSLGPMIIGRAATADALLNLLLALTLFDVARALESPQAAAPRRRAFLWVGLGVLAKGPVAVLLPVAALALWWLLAPKRGAAWAAIRPLLADPPAWLIAIAAALPWYAYALHRHGRAFIDGFFLRHNLERFSGPMEGHGGSLFYYLIALPLLMLPWSAALWPVLRDAVRQTATGRAGRADPLARWLLCWAGFVLVFFSLSGTKLPHYALYGLTPLLLLAARALTGAPISVPMGEPVGARLGARMGEHIGAAIGKPTGLPRAVLLATGLAAAASFALAAATPELAAWLAQRQPDPHWAERLRSAPGLSVSSTTLLLALGAALLAAVALVWRAASAGGRTAGLLVAAGIAAAGWSIWALPWWGQALQGPVKTLATKAAREGWTLVQWQLHQPSSGFYRGAPVPRREPAAGEVALMRSDRLVALPAAERSTLQEVARDGGYVLVKRAP